MSEIIQSYKGFNEDMTCTPTDDIKFQYEEGGDYEFPYAKVCEDGAHGCEYPLDCLKYYPPSKSIYHEIEQSGRLSRENTDSKVASTRIKIGASISITGLIKAAIEYTTKRTKEEADSDRNYGASSATGTCGASSATGYRGASSATGTCGASSATGTSGASSATGTSGASSATGDYGASSATGACGASSATGICGASSATGDYGASSATGYQGASSATGDYGASSATGYRGASSATGICGASSATGDYGASSATGACGASSATGYRGASSAEDKNAIAVAWGYKSKAKGVLGAYLVFADWEGNESECWGPDSWRPDSWRPDSWILKGAKMVRVDGETIKEGTWYQIENGEIIKAEE